MSAPGRPAAFSSVVRFAAPSALALALIAGLTCVSGLTLAERMPVPPQGTDAGARAGAPASPPPAPAIAGLVGASNAIADAAEAALPAVVNISTSRVRKEGVNGFGGPFESDPLFKYFFGEPRQGQQGQRSQSLGSGVIVTEQGLVLTNNHVVQHADEIDVTLADGREFSAEIIGSDPATDLAVIQLKGKDLGSLSYLPLGDADALRLGEIVLAVGNPFGLSGSVTMGIVSGKGRANVGIVDYEDFIQTDAAINPGNSGGALLNLDGELVGINTAIASRSGGSQGVGFAIPSTLAGKIMARLVDEGTVQRSWLGVYIQRLSPEMAPAFAADNVKGVLVAEVRPGSPARKGGVLRGDVIVSFDGKAIEKPSELRNLVALTVVGKTVKLTVFRDGKRKNLMVKLTTLPEARVERPSEPSEKVVERFSGLGLGELDEYSRQRYRIGKEVTQGVIVRSVDRGSAAAHAGIKQGVVIVELNRKPVRGMADLKGLDAEGDRAVLALVVRDGASFYIVVG